MKKPFEKAKYDAPKLTVFGSVRNLTGGSQSRFRDGALTTRF
jgi:hypothetical protein